MAARRKEDVPKDPWLCEWCGTTMDPEWARTNQAFCSRKCKNAEWYARHKLYHRKKYLNEKKRWERSPTGKRGGVPLKVWLKMPEDFK